MEAIYLDSHSLVPGFEEQRFEPSTWVVLNQSSMDLREDINSFADLKPWNDDDADNIPSDLDWTNQPARFDLSRHWHAWIPTIPFGEKKSKQWYLQFDRQVAVTRIGDKVAYKLKEAAAEEFKGDLWQLYHYIEEITDNNTFGGDEQPRPQAFHYNALSDSYESEEAVQRMVARARRSALEYLGFVNWWIACIPGKANWLSEESRGEIAELGLGKMAKRGIIIKPYEDWRGINLPALVGHDVPVFYQWDFAEYTDKRFGRLDPAFLRAYRSAVRNAKNPVTIAAMPRSIPNIEDLAEFNEFLDEIDGPPLPINSTAFKYMKESWFVVDHEGWHRRSISQLAAAHMEREGVAKCVRQIGGERYTTYLRWRKKLPVVASPLPGEVVDEYDDSVDDDFDEGLADPSHIREFYKGRYAPKPGEEVDSFSGILVITEDTMTGVEASPLSAVEPKAETSVSGALADQISEERMVFTTPEIQPTLDPILPTEPKADRDRKEGLGTRPLKDRISGWGNKGKARGSPSNSWVRSMTQLSEGVGHGPSRGGYPRTRSASPARGGTSHRDSTPRPLFKPTDSRGEFVALLRAWGRHVTIPGKLWDVSDHDVIWHPYLFSHGYLIVENEDAQVRMRYWATCEYGMLDIKDVLTAAINSGVAFKIGIKLEDIHHFRPASITLIERKLIKSRAQVGYKEATLAYSVEGTFLQEDYLGNLGNVLQRPHAGALIGLGGPYSWIARYFGGSEILQKFIGGPSILTTCHNKGESDSTDDDALYIQYDCMNQGELDLVIGFISSGGPESDRWLFPPEALLWELCEHYSGEWNDYLEEKFTGIAKAIEKGNPRALTRGGWRKFFRRGHRGSGEPDEEKKQEVFSEGKSLVSNAFKGSWHKKELSSITLPEEYFPVTGRKWGAL